MLISVTEISQKCIPWKLLEVSISICSIYSSLLILPPHIKASHVSTIHSTTVSSSCRPPLTHSFQISKPSEGAAFLYLHQATTHSFSPTRHTKSSISIYSTNIFMTSTIHPVHTIDISHVIPSYCLHPTFLAFILYPGLTCIRLFHIP